jgi:glutamine synthetase
MRPNRFAPMQSDVGNMDRGSAVRICPAPGNDPGRCARQFNVEFRVADATASPYLALAMLVQAGLDGIRQRRDLEAHVPQPLPDSLDKALTRLEASGAAEEWLGPKLLPAYVAFKRAEIKGMEGLDESEICRRYEQVY